MLFRSVSSDKHVAVSMGQCAGTERTAVRPPTAWFWLSLAELFDYCLILLTAEACSLFRQKRQSDLLRSLQARRHGGRFLRICITSSSRPFAPTRSRAVTTIMGESVFCVSPNPRVWSGVYLGSRRLRPVVSSGWLAHIDPRWNSGNLPPWGEVG